MDARCSRPGLPAEGEEPQASVVIYRSRFAPVTHSGSDASFPGSRPPDGGRPGASSAARGAGREPGDKAAWVQCTGWVSSAAHRRPLPHAAGHSDGYRRLQQPATLLLAPKGRFWSCFPGQGFSHGNASARGLKSALATSTRAGCARGRPGLTRATGRKDGALRSPQRESSELFSYQLSLCNDSTTTTALTVTCGKGFAGLARLLRLRSEAAFIVFISEA